MSNFNYQFTRDDTTEFTPSVAVTLNGKNVAHLPLFGRVIRQLSVGTLSRVLTQEQLSQLVAHKNPVSLTTDRIIHF